MEQSLRKGNTHAGDVGGAVDCSPLTTALRLGKAEKNHSNKPGIGTHSPDAES